MPHWILHCPLCKTEFIHSEIAMNLEMAELCFPRKPIVPGEGLRLECPNCRNSSVFNRDHLVYSRE
jgi:hypothetical protein